MQSYVRAANTDALSTANKRINRAISAAAASNGCKVTICDIAGSEPLNEDKRLAAVCLGAYEEIAGKDGYLDETDCWQAGSTDMGDLSVNFPAIHPFVAGAVGGFHGKDFFIQDPVKACVNGAILEFTLLRRLLENNAAKAKEIKANYKPVFPTIKDYVAFKKTQTKEVETVIDNSDGSITIL
jgi:metal-dependent amidase/aminoacylase/carboxypeptidase family protein